jgi:hypothetical protein
VLAGSIVRAISMAEIFTLFLRFFPVIATARVSIPNAKIRVE